MSDQICCETKWLREVICGKIQFRKCPVCDNNGIEIQAYDKNGNPAPSGYEGDTQRYECGNCNGLAFIENPH